MEGSKTVLLVGTLDTKGAEYAYLRERLRAHGVDSILADAGVNEPVRRRAGHLHVGAETGADPRALAEAGDRGAAVTAMAEAAEALARRLYAEGRIGGVLAAGGSGNTAIATRAMQALPVGAPKLMVSTMAAGNTADYVGASDVTMMASVTDVAGVNSISARILANAAAAMAGMVQAPPVELGEQRPLIGASMFGVTTPVRDARARAARGARLRGADLPRDRRRREGDGGADGVRLPRRACSTSRRPSCATSWSAACCRPGRTGSRRRGALGLPQVVSLGALDMVNFGARATVPPQFEDRNLYVHNPSVTLMRTTKDEMRRARAPDRAQAVGGDRPDRAVHPAARASR